ncbi:MAG: DUF5309 domain-containing protein [Muribaculaceae bacterium]|nr:DUF5309 domain-containing protein [Muribaculaceae bacterium]
MENTANNAALVSGTSGGTHVASGPLTTDLAREASPSLLRSAIDSRVVRLRPMATPVDQISRWAGARHAASMEVDYYAVDTKPSEARLKTSHVLSSDSREAIIFTTDDRIFEPSETILVPSVEGVDPADGETPQPLVLYVISKPDSGGLKVVAVNGVSRNKVDGLVPSINAETVLVRMGRAAGELDVQTAQFEALPQKMRNYCQIFKAQVEQSTLMRLADKEVGWTLSDQEEAAVYDMRLGMEKSFLFGSRSRLNDPQKRTDIYFTGGIWNQTGHEFSYERGKFGGNREFLAMMRQAFTGNAGSSRKILIAGSGLVETLSRFDAVRVAAAKDAVTKWGLDFQELCSKFGTLYIIHSEVFDICGHEDDGMVIDPQFLTKYSHIPLSTQSLDLKGSGLRNTDATVITEASCLVLRYPEAHMRIVARNGVQSE